jgi:hypothetical protein
MIFIFDCNNEDIAISSDTQEDAEMEIRILGILAGGGITFHLKRIMGAI